MNNNIDGDNLKLVYKKRIVLVVGTIVILLVTIMVIAGKKLKLQLEEQQNINEIAEDGEYWIPTGFKEAEDSAETIKEGKVIEDEKGNQFVWIPCYVKEGVKTSEKCAVEYKRTDFGKGSDIELCSEELNAEDLESIKKYGGFYIGRFETGKDEKENVVIKRFQNPYNFIKLSDCKIKAIDFAKINKYNTDKVYTKITSSYAWDTALQFIEKTVENYAINSPQGNYLSTGLLKTGETQAVCNIYDMGGNLWEYTTETYDDIVFQYIARGGNFYVIEAEVSAGGRKQRTRSRGGRIWISHCIIFKMMDRGK